MVISPLSMLILSVLTTYLMVVVFGLFYYSERKKQYRNILEFWVCYGVYYMASMYTSDMNPKIVALCTLGWIWRLRTIRLMLEDISGKSFRPVCRSPLVIVGYGTSLVLGMTQDNFALITFPAALSIFIVGMTFVFKVYKELKTVRNPIPHKLLLLTITIICLHILDYPFLRYEVEAGLGYGLVFVTTILMAVILPAVSTLKIQEGYMSEMEKVIQERGRLLEGQSKFFALGEMTAGIVHEINNPLGIIIHRTSHMKDYVISDKAEKDFLIRNLEQIEATSDRVSKIITSLRNFSRDNKSEEFQKVKVNTVLEETLIYCTDRFRLGGVRLLVDSYSDAEVEIRPVQISQVLLNLFNNAFDAVIGTHEPWIHIITESTPDGVRILIKDSGLGIPEPIRIKMMEPFFTTKEMGGTGLGLSISKGIVEDHGGRFFYDKTCENTCFVVELPLKQMAYHPG